MGEEKTDLRVIKTRERIRRALLDLLDGQPFEEITVSQIVREALISRSTFYDHYTDKYALLDDMYEEVRRQLQKLTEQHFDQNSGFYELELAGSILAYVLANAQLFRALLSDKASTRDLFAILREVLEPKGLAYLEQHPNRYEFDKEFVVEVYSSIIYLSMQWIVKKQNPADLVRMIGLFAQVRDLFFD